jgi:hypothetical protein
MKRLLTCVLIIGAAATGIFGQQADKAKLLTPSQKSPPQEASATIGGKQIWIAYHAPSVRGRKIFGGKDALQPDGTIWRLGANQATVLHTDGALDIAGLTVPAGDYSLYIDLDEGKWQLIVNKQTGQWGIKPGGSSMDPAQNVGKVALNMSKPPALVEQLKISLSDSGAGKGELKIEWENVVATAAIAVK